MGNKAVTLIELLIVMIIVAILATVSIPLFEKTRERGLDKEAVANLKLVQSAERIYQMETGVFLACGNVNCINSNMRLSIPAGSNRSWNYDVVNVGLATFRVRGIRYSPPSGWNRTWRINQSDEDATCVGAGCP